MHIQAPFEAYRGDEPYLFVSYAHRDSERVYPVLSMLRERGWRIWYDEGIDPGNEWTAFIEGALVGCAQMLCFISPNSVESLNCRQEINLAVDDGKSVLAVHLEETELRYGLRLRMSAFQAVMAHRIASNGELLRTLDRGLDPACREGDDSSSIEPKDEAARTPARSLKGERASGRFAVIAGAAVALIAAAAVAAFVFAGRVGSEAAAPLPVAVQDIAADSAQETLPAEEASPSSGSAAKSGTPEKPAAPDAAQKAAPQEPKKPQAPAVPKGFVLIDGGSFVMGTPAKEALSDDNELLHTVSLSPFYIGAREVTQSEWESVMGSNPSAFKGGSLPVESVSWYEAIAFCNKLSVNEGRQPCYKV
ncbi:MAG: TIR domain-containing protein, partial [Spirochaetales bacterium]|nr:TIR domain-containing protein [Spirochaetales bacterium]